MAFLSDCCPSTGEVQDGTFRVPVGGFRSLVVVIVVIACSITAQAQTASVDAAELLPSPGILRNSVTNLHAEGDSLWVGPFLNLTTDDGQTWQVADADSLSGFRNRVFSIDAEGDVIWVGLGTQRQQEINGQAQSVSLARGFLFSTDGGQTWTYRSPLPPPDNDPETTGILDLPEDTLITYGATTLPTLAITVPEDSPPWDIDVDPATGTIWTANQLAGIRASTDDGRTWRRVVLPPDTTAFLSPDLGYQFPFLVQPVGIPPLQFEGLNFQAFAVLVDGAGSVWAGTVGGLNRSTDGGTSWRHFSTQDGMPGNWVISIEEQPRPGQEPVVWATTWPGTEEGGRFGLVATRDSGDSFERMLVGERIFDTAFREDTVYAAGENGLFISDDDGLTWRTVRDFFDPSQPERTVKPDVEVFSVATTDEALWVGTSDGLFRSTDGAQTWRLFRAQVPLNPDDAPEGVPRDAVPEVETYAYPNPFSPAADRLVRIRFDLDRPQPVNIRIFDFGMNLVRDLIDDHLNAGAGEVAWDGTAGDGTRVANGTYFYRVATDDDTVWGKILILE